MKGNISQCIYCPRIRLLQEAETWIVMRKVTYYAFPCVFLVGLLLGITNIIITGRNIRNARDTYFLAYIIPSTLVVLFGGVLRLSDYMNVTGAYYQAFDYLCSLHNWFYYTSIWILLITALERTIYVSRVNPHRMCTSTKAMIVSCLIFCVCFISILPQFWQCLDKPSTTVAVTNKTNHSDKGYRYQIDHQDHNKLIYLWYTFSITMFIPFPTYSVCVFFLSKVIRLKRNSRRRHSLQHGTGNILNRQATGQMRINRLYISLLILLILLTGPRLILHLLQHISAGEAVEPVYIDELFDLLFYLYFTLPFFLFCKYSQNFRSTMVHTFCFCMKQKCQKQLEKTYSIHEV